MNDTSIRTGTSAILNSLNNIQRNSPFQTENGFDARVSYVLLDDSNKEKFDKYGGFDSIGLIECFRIIDGDLDIEPIIAFPINSNIRRFPVENEVVKIISSTNNSSQNKLNSKKLSFYYGDIIGTWGSTEHNSVPNEVIINKNGPNDKLSEYNEVGAGILKKDTKIEEMSITGDSFKETGNVRKLKHLPGDITYEGRFGNSIRFGGSNNKFKSPWKGFDNSPIIIISNNHGSVVKNNIEPIYEDINKDGSSIFLLSGQEINFIPASINFESYNKKIDIKNNIIKPSILRVDDNKSSSVGDEENINRIVEDTSTIYKNEITGSSKPIFEDDVIFLPDREDPQEGEIIFDDIFIQPRSYVKEGYIQLETYHDSKKINYNNSGLTNNINLIKSYILEFVKNYPILKNDKNAKNKIKALIVIMANETGYTFKPLVENLGYRYSQASQIFNSINKLNKSEFIQLFGGDPVKNQTNFGNYVYGLKATKSMGLGNSPDNNDGFNFRGRGLFQITGKSSYRAISEKMYNSSNLTYKNLVTSPNFFVDNFEKVNDKNYLIKIFMFAFFEGGVCSKGYSIIKGPGSNYYYNNVNDVLRLINSGLVNNTGNKIYYEYLSKFNTIYNNREINDYIENILK